MERNTNPNAVMVGRIRPFMHRPDPIEPFEAVIAFPARKLTDSEVA